MLRVLLYNDIFAHGRLGGGVALQTTLGSRDHNLWHLNTGGNLTGASHGPNAVFADPTFVAWSDDGDPSNDDFSLQGQSPAVDAGLPTYFDSDGTISDIGYTGARP